MKLWLGVSLGLLVLLVFSLQVKAEGPPDRKCGYKGEDIFQSKDTDKDGKISKEEWVQKYNDKFQEIDTDGDGFLSEEEIRARSKAKWGGHKKHSGKCVKGVPEPKE